MAARYIAVIDIGKTNAKVVLYDLTLGRETKQFSTPNKVVTGAPYPHYDVEALWRFILASLKALSGQGRVDAISITTHGASAALLRADGSLALPVLDYECDGPQALAAEYDAARPTFDETGSPRLPNGLNLAAQIFWQQHKFADAFAQVKWIVTYPQYWAFRLSGVLANEVTSLGCHTDLWAYARSDYSSLVEAQGWRKMMPPLRKANAVLGVVTADVARATGLPSDTPVMCGIHDSNASLLPHLVAHEKPFAVVSTGTWVICMAIGGRAVKLDPARDTLVNVNAFGIPVPSARFMGGREFELLKLQAMPAATDQDIAHVLEAQAMLFPSVVQGSGPFAHQMARWHKADTLWPPQRHVVASFYLAMMTATCLEYAGAEGPIIVEGPFARNHCFTRMLSAATGKPVEAKDGTTGTATGAASLCGEITSHLPRSQVFTTTTQAYLAYAKAWREGNSV